MYYLIKNNNLNNHIKHYKLSFKISLNNNLLVILYKHIVIKLNKKFIKLECSSKKSREEALILI
jgi:hypothetical protein